MIHLTTDAIDVARVIEAVRSPKAGAVVLFLGTARDSSGGRAVRSLEYQAYDAMARKELSTLEAQARATWQLVDCAIVHRLGEVALGETSVAIAVSAAHREAAFEAGRWLIDRIKEVVPIWKRENWTDGSGDWVHPMIDLPGA
jgi:molybdopterin synthase catalytic subunit